MTLPVALSSRLSRGHFRAITHVCVCLCHSIVHSYARSFCVYGHFPSLRTLLAPLPLRSIFPHEPLLGRTEATRQNEETKQRGRVPAASLTDTALGRTADRGQSEKGGKGGGEDVGDRVMQRGRDGKKSNRDRGDKECVCVCVCAR